MSTLSKDELTALLAGLGIKIDPSNYPESNFLARPLDVFRASAADVVAQLTGVTHPIAYDSVQSTNTLANGDLSLPVPRLRLKGKKPNDLASELAANFPDHKLWKKPTAVGIHLPLYVNPTPLPQFILPYIFQRLSSYGQDLTVGLRNPASPEAGRKKVIIDFSSPNIAKEFHAGHLRSTIIGAYVANLYEAMGYDVVKINYLGDWGKQFGLLAVGWQRFGNEEELAKEPLKHLLSVYQKISAEFRPEEEASKKAREEGRDTAEIESKGLYAERNAIFRRMEDGDTEAVALWRRFRDVSIERYISTYQRLNITFDEYSGESQVKASTVQVVEKMLREKGIYEEDNGAWLIDFKKHGAKNLGLAIVRGRTGTTTYLLRDVAAVLQREEQYGFDKAIYVVSSEQDLYFQRLFKTIELMGRPDLAARLQHVNFGKVLGMSSRKGGATLLGDILDEAREAMHDVMRRNEVKYAQIPDPNAVAEVVGITAVMVQDMAGKRINNYPFDLARMTSFEGDTGPYLQYCHARLNSILRKADLTRTEIREFIAANPNALDADVAGNKHCADLLRLMVQYPDATATAAKNVEPSTMLTYLFRLAHQISSSYDTIQVVGAPEGRDTVIARAALFEASRQVLENGMKLLGFTPVERM